MKNITSPQMTNNEIIGTLKGLIFGSFDRTTSKEREALSMAIEALKGQKAGKWIAYKGMQPPELHGKHYCSNCYHAIHLASNGNVYNYCPNCGAKMEVEHENL